MRAFSFLALPLPFCQRLPPFFALPLPFCQRRAPLLALPLPVCQRLTPLLAALPPPQVVPGDGARAAAAVEALGDGRLRRRPPAPGPGASRQARRRLAHRSSGPAARPGRGGGGRDLPRLHNSVRSRVRSRKNGLESGFENGPEGGVENGSKNGSDGPWQRRSLRAACRRRRRRRRAVCRPIDHKALPAGGARHLPSRLSLAP